MRSHARKILFTAVCFTFAFIAQAQDATQPPPTQHPILTLQATGSQIYICQNISGKPQWVFTAPSARLFDAPGNEVGTHGDGPIWSYQDGSSIQGVVQSKSPAPEPDSIPWLLLKAVNPQRFGILTTVSFIRRSDTKGGVVPATVCDLDHQGVLARIPYTATYTFYSAKP